VADIADIIRGMNGPSFGRPVQDLEDVDSAPSDERMGAYYIRLSVKDEPGVLAAITHELAHKSVSLDIVLQKARDPGANVPLILVTHDTREGNLREALGAIAKQPSVAETPIVIRIFQS
ncbi:MAG TPA: homoserine dehydrogenase, partial [Alphaproteobacteria bacterium]|nr:homoserine dehydrogenase [Alphaproteobacteria bacterium]